jgi:tetratricopeptide (TPR) repeat protein
MEENHQQQENAIAREKKIRDKLLSNPGDPACAILAEFLRKQGRTQEALEVCLNGLTVNPTLVSARIVLARLYLQKGWLPFCTRELRIAYRLETSNLSVLKLLQLLDANFNLSVLNDSQGKETLIAETEFDLDLF